MKTRLIALIAFTAVVAAACSTGLSEQRALTGAAPAGPGGTSVEIPNREDRPQQPGRPALGENARPYVETLELSIEDIQAFWTTKMPKVFGQEFEPIPNDKIFAYSQNNPPPACGTGQQPSADDLVGNAFYCSEGGFIAFDDENLFPKLYKNFGSYAVAMVLAHEWGHAVQDQMGISGGNVPTVYLEQQADCFAGAWTKWVDDGDSPNLSLSPGSLDAALGGMLEFRDEPGTNPNDPAAHGSGFDRVRVPGWVYQGPAGLRRLRDDPTRGVATAFHPGGVQHRREHGVFETGRLAGAGLRRLDESRFPLLQTAEQGGGLRPRHRQGHLR